MLKIIKWVLIVIVALAALLYGGGYFLSPKFTVARSVTINAPPDKVYALVANPREWKKWSVWNQRDPNMQITYEGPESGAGAKWTWQSKNEGSGSMTFTKAEPGKMVAYDLYFPDFKTTSTGSLALVPEGQGTKITWTMNGDMGSNPLFRWVALNADSMIGKDFQAGLNNLKSLAEKS